MKRSAAHGLPACALAAALGAAIATSCAAPIKLESSVDALALLEPGALAYARVSGQAARELAPALLGPSKAASASRLLERTRVVALSIEPAAGRAVDPASAPDEDQAPEASEPAQGSRRDFGFQAALLGDYPFRAASLSLGSSPDWKRDKPGYRNDKLGIYAAVPGPGLVLASDRPLAPLLAAAKAPGASPIPERLAALSSKELVLWAPRPFQGLAAALLGGELDLPVRGILVAASPAAGDRERCEATVVFMMEDAKAVRTYKTVLKIAWYGIAKALFAEEADAALATPMRTDGELLLVSDLVLSREAIVKALSSLGGIERR
jgi:hypothetical protein